MGKMVRNEPLIIFCILYYSLFNYIVNCLQKYNVLSVTQSSKGKKQIRITKNL